MFLPLVLVLLSFLATFCPAVTASAALVSALATNNSGLFSPDQKSAERQSDNVTLTDYGRIGVCYSYLSFFCTDYKDGWNRDKMLEACKIYCPTQQLSDGYGVRLSCLFKTVQSTNILHPVSCASQHLPFL